MKPCLDLGCLSEAFLVGDTPVRFGAAAGGADDGGDHRPPCPRHRHCRRRPSRRRYRRQDQRANVSEYAVDFKWRSVAPNAVSCGLKYSYVSVSGFPHRLP